KRRLSARPERHEVDAEVRQAARVAEAPLHAFAHPRAERFGIARAATLGHGCRIEGGQAQVRHRNSSYVAGRHQSMFAASGQEASMRLAIRRAEAWGPVLRVALRRYNGRPERPPEGVDDGALPPIAALRFF